MLSPGDQVLIDGEDSTRRCTVVAARLTDNYELGQSRCRYDLKRTFGDETLTDVPPGRITGHWIQT